MNDRIIVATEVSSPLAISPQNSDAQWSSAEPIRFSADWEGRNPDSSLETEVRCLWSPDALYLRFVCRYHELFVFEDSDPNGRRDHLWDRDVAEAFLQPPPATGKNYKEFEVAPNSMWIDLLVSPLGLENLRSGLSRSVYVDEARRIWSAELAVPMKALTESYSPQQSWRVNFYRVEGKSEPRRYMAWQPTHTPQPNFHVPENFGTMIFR